MSQGANDATYRLRSRITRLNLLLSVRSVFLEGFFMAGRATRRDVAI